MLARAIAAMIMAISRVTTRWRVFVMATYSIQNRKIGNSQVLAPSAYNRIQTASAPTQPTGFVNVVPVERKVLWAGS